MVNEEFGHVPQGYVCASEAVFHEYTCTIKECARYQTKAEEMEKELRSLKAEMANMRKEYNLYKEFFAESSNSYHKKCYEEFIAERHPVEIPKEF